MSNFLKLLHQRFIPSTRKADLLRGRNPTVALGCVVDSKDIFVYQAARLLLSLRWNGGRMANSPFYLASTSLLPARAHCFFERHGATIRYCKPFDECNHANAHIPSNKLRLFELTELEQYDHVVLIDCDTIIAQDPYDYFLVDGIGAKLADVPTVTDEQIRQVMGILGIKKHPKPAYKFELVEGETIGYFNSGVVSFSKRWLKPFTDRWASHSRELLKLSGNLPFKEFHLNQAALAATIADLQPPISEFPSEMNFPVHFAKSTYPSHYDGVDPIIIHYHQLVDQDGLIAELPLKRAWERAQEFNERVKVELARLQNTWRRPTVLFPKKADAVNPKVIVGSGWWSNDKPHQWAKGEDVTTRVEFFRLWYRQIRKYIDPFAIVITDSHSPLKPDWEDFDGVTWIELDRNYGHPNDLRVGNIETKYSGFTRSVINGAMFALCCDADFYVYVEQDCLIRGDNFLHHAIGDGESDVMFGDRTRGGKGINGKSAAPMYQQSFIVVRKRGLEDFISGVMAGPETDGELSPEVKMARDLGSWDVLKVPYGRSRPIDFARSHFYVQHLQREELRRFLEIEDIQELGLLDRSQQLLRL